MIETTEFSSASDIIHVVHCCCI